MDIDPVLNQSTRHEDVWGVEVQLQSFLILALDGDEWSASHLGRFTPGGRVSGTP